MKKAVFVTSAIGDYHVPRFEAIAKELQKYGWSFEVLATSAEPQDYSHRAMALYEPKNLWSFDWEYLSIRGSDLRVARLAGKTILRILQKRPNIVFCIGYSSMHSFAALIAAKLKRVPVIFCASSKFDDGDRNPFREALKSCIVRCFDGAIVAGEKHAHYYRFLGIQHDTIRIGYSVVDNAFFSWRSGWARHHSKLVRKIFNLKQRYMLCVSRLIYRKRVDRVIEAYAASVAASLDVHLLIVGDGPEKPALRKLVKSLGVETFVHFIRALSNRAIPFVYGLSKFVVLGSDYDQWGLCLNEAMASSVPVICTIGCGAADELVKNGVGGLIAQPHVDDLAEKINLMLNEDIRNRLSREAPGVVGQWSLSLLANNVLSYCK